MRASTTTPAPKRVASGRVREKCRRDVGGNRAVLFFAAAFTCCLGLTVAPCVGDAADQPRRGGEQSTVLPS